MRQQKAISYEEYLERVKQLAKQMQPGSTSGSVYPSSLDIPAKPSLYDNLERDEALYHFNKDVKDFIRGN